MPRDWNEAKLGVERRAVQHQVLLSSDPTIIITSIILFVLVIIVVLIIIFTISTLRFRNVRKDGGVKEKGKMSREGTGAPSDPIDIVVKEENVEVDKGEDHDEILIRLRLDVKECIHQ